MTLPCTKQRWVGHADLDVFYASVEQRDCPEYRDRPVVVGALPGHRGVVAAANYRARAFGIHSAMPIGEAYRRCPDAVFLRPDMARYAQVSREVFQILGTITPVVEPVSVDEAYLDLTGLEKLSGSVVTLKIRFTGFETRTRQHKLSCSTQDERVILREAWALFLHGNLPRKPVRLIGVGISDWQQAEPVQADLFDQPQKREKDDRLLETVDRAANRFGKGILQLGCTVKASKRKTQ